MQFNIYSSVIQNQMWTYNVQCIDMPYNCDAVGQISTNINNKEMSDLNKLL